MAILLSIPAILSLLLLSAHFLRNGQVLIMVLTLVLNGVLLVPQRWAIRLVQVVLLLGFIEWAMTLGELVARRQAAGEPWLRGALILGAVALLCLAGAVALQFRKLPGR